MLSTNTNDSLVVLIRDMERDRCWHLLLNQVQSVLRSLVLRTAYVYVEVVLVEPVKNDLNVALV